VQIEALAQGTRQARGQPVPTDAQGHFRLVLAPGSYTLEARWQHRFRCEADGRIQFQAEAAQTTKATIVLEEPRAPALRLRVQEADGAPARLTPLWLYPHASSNPVRTDASGRLELCAPSTIAPDSPLIVQTLDQRRAALVTQTNGQSELTVQLRPLPLIRGRVIHMSGSPVKRFHLELAPRDFPGYVSTDFLGDQFELREVPLGRSQLFVTVDDGRRAQVPINMSPGVDVRLEIPLYAGVPLTGRIVDASTGAPLADVYVSVPLFAHARTARDGRFTFPDLPAGEHVLVISRGTLQTSRTVTLEPDQNLNLGDIAFAPR
jgi:hypothetical protein